MERSRYVSPGSGFLSNFWPEWEQILKLQDDDYGRYSIRSYPLRTRLRGETLIPSHTIFGNEEMHTGEGVLGVANYRMLYGGDEHDYLDKMRCFRASYHCLANFIPVSYSMNSHKGNRSAFGDFPDLYLRVIRGWFMGEYYGEDNHPLNKTNELGNHYLGNFGVKEQGWERFVDSNYLMGSFVDDSYQIKDLFISEGSYEGHSVCDPLPKTRKQMPL